MNININSINSIHRKNGFNNLKKSKKKGNKFFAYLTILVILIGVPVACIVYVYSLKQDKSISDWKPNVTDDVKIKRTSYRGSIISIILMLSSLVQATLKGLGASPTMLLLLYGFFMASVLGFMGDQGYGTDEGFSLKEIGKAVKGNTIDGLGAQLKYIFGTLNTSSFWRFIITVFLDMFISSPIQSVIVAVFNPHIELLKNTTPTLPKIIGSLLNIVIKNFDNVLQSFVAFITFLAYANETRFKWAYPGSDINPNLLISTSVIKLSTAIAGVVYLIANISADFNIINGATMKVGTSLVDRLDRKMWFVLIMICLLTVGSLNQDSFLNKKNNRYDVKPLVNMTDDKVWHLEDAALNNYYNREIEKLVLGETNQKKITELQKEICKPRTGRWNTCDVDTKTGNLKLTPDTPGSHSALETLNDYKKDVDAYSIKLNDNNVPIIDDDGGYITATNGDKQKELSALIKEYNEDNNPPCFIPDDKFLCNCKDYLYKHDTQAKDKTYDDYIKNECDKEDFQNEEDNIENQYLNENNGRLVKKIDMGLYRTHSSNIEDKYDIIDKSKEGFGIFCFYILIGIVIPFVPIKFIYGDELEEKGRLSKLILIFIIAYGIAGILYFISTKSPTSEDLRNKEKEILNP